ncbi:MAG: FxLYD domain-containing protein [Azonexus sp.]|nr:FxLYD domain-containing protein [Azonexus sp.]
MKIAKITTYGFFFGLGLSIAAWSAYIVAYALWPKQACTSTETQSQPGKVAAREVVEITGVEEHKHGGRVYFTGVVKNTGQVPAYPSNIEVNLFKGGKFVDQYSTYIAGKIQPGEARFFKATCECRDTATVADYDSFQVQVAGGY